MCGLAGLIDRQLDAATLRGVASRMADTLQHRGPDDGGVWSDPGQAVALSHRRLAILDLSPDGHQPMATADGGLVVVFNGEIYNWPELRAELESLGHAFRSRSDTEVLLLACRQWGVPAALRRLRGMFSFALWDARSRELWLARDRLGEKPLYWGRLDEAVVFASELKALRVHPRWRGGIDRGATALFLRHGYIPAPYTIHPGIAKLPPGTWLRFGPDGQEGPVPYWSAAEAAARGRSAPFSGSASEAADELERLLRAAVREQMVADVPLGAFLSGGIDSSTVVALMQAQSTRQVRTCTIGFGEPDFDETVHAAAVAQHLGTDHITLTATPADALAVIPRLPDLYDEPFADSSQIPTALVCAMARQHVTVALSGDGGDELFAGYVRYTTGTRIWSRAARLPRWLRRAIGTLIGAVPVRAWEAYDRILPTGHRQFGRKAQVAGSLLRADGIDDAYHAIVSNWLVPGLVLPGASEPPTALTRPGADWPTEPVARMQLFDQLTYLPDDILAKVDRAAMGVALETRVPMLDQRLVEFAWSLPERLLLQDGVGKLPLRAVLARHVPTGLTDRPKQGFAMPVGDWLRGPLRPWAEDLLAGLATDGLFDPAMIRSVWRQHLAGRQNHAYRLWPVLMFQAWRRRWMP